MASVESDVQFARALATEIGDALLAVRDELFARYEGQEIKDRGDALAQAIIDRQMRARRPLDAVLSEEAVDDLSRLTADRVWIVDPLDGTREFARQGRIDWGVHIALWDASQGALTAAAVALPAQGVLFATDEQVNRAPQSSQVVRIVASQSRTPEILQAVGEAMPIEIVLWGSAGAKAARVITGDVDAYIHDSDLNEWDSAAPTAVALANGLHVSRLDGSAFTFNQRVPVTGGILMCRAELADDLLAAVNS